MLKDSFLEVEKSRGVLEIFDYYLENIFAKLNKGYEMETYNHYKYSVGFHENLVMAHS